MQVIYYEVGKKPEVIEIENELKELQKLVGGWIELFPLPNGLQLICNEEGKLIGLPLNRIVNGEPIAGNFFICRNDGEELASVTKEDIEKFC